MLEGLAIPCDTITPLLDMAVSLGFEPRRRSSRLDAFEAPAIDQLCQLTMVGAERIELSSDDYKSSALTFVLRTYGLQRRIRTFSLSCRRRPLCPVELFGEEGGKSHPRGFPLENEVCSPCPASKTRTCNRMLPKHEGCQLPYGWTRGTDLTVRTLFVFPSIDFIYYIIFRDLLSRTFLKIPKLFFQIMD